MALGRGSTTVPSNTIASSLGFASGTSSYESSIPRTEKRAEPADKPSGRGRINQLVSETIATTNFALHTDAQRVGGTTEPIVYAQPMVSLSPEQFEREVVTALDLLPAELLQLMDNVIVVTGDRHDSEPDILGLYEGIPLTERDGYGLFELPDRISIYRLPLMEMCSSSEELIEEIQVTVIHEIAHHFGIDDDQLHEMGWG